MSAESNDQGTKVQDSNEVLEPSVPERIQTIGRDDYEYAFVQKPLSFFGKLDFFAVLGKAIDQTMSGPDGLSLAELFEELPNDPEGFRMQDMKDQNTFVRGIAKVVAYSPEILSEIYCVALGVPKGQRKSAKQIMELPESEGGLSDKDGIEVLDTFVEQNWEVLVDFFKGPAKELAQKIGKKAAQQSQSSKRSKSSARTTGSRSKS